MDDDVHGTSPGRTGGSSPGLVPLSEFSADALRYWEPRRWFYNLLLGAIVVGHLLAAWPASRSALTVDGVLRLFLLAVLANVAYSAVYIADLFMQIGGLHASRARWRWPLLVVGFAFAAVLAHFFSVAQLATRNGPG